MCKRCRNPRDGRWLDYGGRGITVCDVWCDPETGFEAFLIDMGPRPVGKTLDRLDNNGPYELINCKWSTSSEQALNRRKRSGTSSKFPGVHWHKASGKWAVSVRGKHLGVFFDETEAAQVASKARVKIVKVV